MRNSIDELDENKVIFNGFDYQLQVWVKNGVIENCSHPDNSFKGHGCCNARALHGRKISEVQGHEVRP